MAVSPAQGVLGGLSVDWFREVNGYCERTDPSYWSEPVNALSNLAFLVAAVLCWHLSRGRRDWGVTALILVLGLIGIGSYLFHTHAQVWALFADVLPITGFILLCIHLATVRFFGLPVWAGPLAVLAYFPYSAAVSRAVEATVGGLNGSVSYIPVPILIGLYAALLWRRRPETARGLAIGTAVLALSLFFRTIDAAVCGAFPLGTHFLWHLLNGAMLGWMILVMLRASPAGTADLRGPALARVAPRR